MKRVLGHCLAGLAVVAGGAGVISACVHDDSSLYIHAVLYPTPVAIGQACLYTADPTAEMLSKGILDVGLGRYQYDAMFLVGNQMVAQANPQQVRTETSDINIQGAEVRITDVAGNQLTAYTALTSGTVLASTGTVPGYAAISATLLDATTARTLNVKGGAVQTVVSYTKMFGHTLGGTYVESNEFEFPIDVCYGCLVLYTAIDTALTLSNGQPAATPNCLAPFQSGSAGATSIVPNPCVTGQDTQIDCSQCQDFTVCRGAYPNGAPSTAATDAGAG